jgi:hypothetical protein
MKIKIEFEYQIPFNISYCNHIWEERCEGVKCERYNCEFHHHAIGWDDWRIKYIKYKRHSQREYKGLK